MKILLFLYLMLFFSCSELKEFVNYRSEKSTIVYGKVDQDSTSDSPADKIINTDSTEPKIITRIKPTFSKQVKKYCELIDKKFHHYGWGKSHCEKYQWNHVRSSHLGRPLIWVAYGDEKAHKKQLKNMTMIFCTVHGDEITPTKFCFDILEDLDKRIHDPVSSGEYKDSLIVVAPIVNPDSFFKKYPTRTNFRKVDVNRNFPTRDWSKKALSLWKKRYRSDKRRYPGDKALSEQETVFQVNLIKRYKPNKIISVHAPLTIIDYDGPHKKKAKNANQLLMQMSNDASGYRIKDYPFYTGSLGNWAGNERKIPTYTLELPTSDNRKSKQYWSRFRQAIRSAVSSDLNKDLNVAEGENSDSYDKNKKL
jgi:murein peptide amidase A